MTKRKKPEEHQKRGRKTLYRAEFAKQAKALCDLGATDKEIADFFNVSVQTIHTWKKGHPEFLDAIKVGKDHADERVIRSLYLRAVGYSFESEKIFNGANGLVRAAYVEHVPPDVTAAIYWLNNRRSADWRTRKAVEASGINGGPIPLEHEHKIGPSVEQALANIIGML